MYFLGLALAIALPLLTLLSEAGRSFVLTTFNLSPEIAVLICIGYAYPVGLFLYAFLTKNTSISRSYFKTQVMLGSTLCVSLGLIGTFIGLSSMVASIASGMNAEGDFSTKIAGLLTAIGQSLDSMSLAFLTSIMGVGASTVLLVACNYLTGYFKDDEKKAEAAGDPAHGAPVVDMSQLNGLKEVLQANSQVQQQMADSLMRMEAANARMMPELLEGLTQALDSQYAKVTAVAQTDPGTHALLDKVDERFDEYIQDFKQGMQALSGSSDKLLEEISGTNSHLREHIQTLAGSSDRLLEEISGSNNHLRQDLQALAGSSTQLVQEISGSNTHLRQDLQSLANSSERLLEEMSGANSYIHGITQHLELSGSNSNELKDFVAELLSQQNVSISELCCLLADLKYLLAPPLEEALATAIEEDTLNVRFQPQYSADRHLLGFEVLLHWVDPIRGKIKNAKVFDSALKNEHALLKQLDRWVINKSIQKVSAWMSEGQWDSDWVISINVTPSYAADISLIEQVRECLETYRVPGRNIAIEIKDEAFIEYPEQAKQVAIAVQELGAKVYVDRYGRGDSSLMKYKKMGINRLKLDPQMTQSLIDELDDTSELRSVRVAAKELDMELIAPGIEREFQLKSLAKLGFDLYQGELLSLPIRDLSELPPPPEIYG